MSAEQKNVAEFPEAEPAFRMIDVGRKRVTRRRAIAAGTITVGPAAFGRIREKSLPKGDVLALAEIAGIMGAKRTPDLIPMCHTLPLDQVEIHCAPQAPDAVIVYAQVVTHAKTGVEMEALVAVQTALATIWDLVKGTEPNLTIGNVRLLVKEGGKSGLWVNPDGIPRWLEAQLPPRRTLEGIKSAILVMSDRASAGVYEDKSGALLKEFLEREGADITGYKIVPDDAGAIAAVLRDMHGAHRPRLIVASGGTGPGLRDVTPDALDAVCDRVLEGFGEVLRRESAVFTETAWLSRMRAGMLGETLVVALPGSPKAVTECWEILRPFLARALKMIEGQGCGGKP
jgi:molybdenum cofactor biosynthesis protein MoaC